MQVIMYRSKIVMDKHIGLQSTALAHGDITLYSKPETHFVILINLVNKILIKYFHALKIIANKNSIG